MSEKLPTDSQGKIIVFQEKTMRRNSPRGMA